MKVIVVGKARLAGHVAESLHDRGIGTNPSRMIQQDRSDVLYDVDTIDTGVGLGQERLDECPQARSVETHGNVVGPVGQVAVVGSRAVGLDRNGFGGERLVSSIEEGKTNVDIPPALVRGVPVEGPALGPRQVSDGEDSLGKVLVDTTRRADDALHQLHRAVAVKGVLVGVELEAFAAKGKGHPSLKSPVRGGPHAGRERWIERRLII